MSIADQPPEGIVWGKWAGRESYPLSAHLLDTAAFASAMLESWVSKPLLRAMAGWLGISVDDPRFSKTLAAVAGLHDCGKADPYFIGQVGARSVDPAITANMAALRRGNLEGVPERFADRFVRVGTDPRSLIRHEAMTGHVLRRAGLPSWVSACVSGHHGRFIPEVEFRHRRAVSEYRKWLDGTSWKAHQVEAVESVFAGIGLNRAGFPEGDVPAGGFVALTGVVCLADWLASDEGFLASHDPKIFAAGPEAYFDHRRGQAKKRLPGTLGIPTRPLGSFSDLFPGMLPDRGVQEWAVSHDHDAGLTLISVPMGEGKTEAALWMHADSKADDGLIFALPTTATTDAMFERVRAFYGSTPTVGALRHSRALLNAFYDTGTAKPMGVCDDEGGLVPSRWMSGRHRSLTAPVTVATCDQVLATAVNHRFLPVRVASLANKHVVLDEVHTYDPYQDGLLRRLLGWCGQLNTRVTLLSATLPTRRAQAYVDAYLGGGSHPLPGGARYPVVTVANDGEVTVDSVAANRNFTHSISCVPIRVGPQSYAEFRWEFAAQTVAYVQGLRDEDQDAVIGVLVNTVDRAISVASRLETRGVDVLIVHSRMTAAQRSYATDRLLNSYGKKGDRGPVTVVATQVAEASLDIDFDILVTDLAPMSSLLQRMGRQWRHSVPRPDDAWEHKVPRRSVATGPRAHVLIPTGDDDQMHQSAYPPYLKAELSKTWNQGLQRGLRSEIRIPEDLQGLVDECDVSWDDLDSLDDTDPGWEEALCEALGRLSGAVESASTAGTDVAYLNAAWDQEPEWDRNAVLAGLTPSTQIWDDAAVTRLRDRETLTVLVYDPTGKTDWAYPSDPSIWAEQPPEREILLQALKCTVNVSGATANALQSSATIPTGWKDQPEALLRETLPISVHQLGQIGLELHARYGVTSKEVQAQK